MVLLIIRTAEKRWGWVDKLMRMRYNVISMTVTITNIEHKMISEVIPREFIC